MNLMMAPTSEKSNMMTCELDLSQHMPLPKLKAPKIHHKRVFSGGGAPKNTASKTLMQGASNAMITNTASYG